tara:strand:- start:199 stop:717 length:519 start_codon:yes stop_codon:yes gene_type:complete
MEFDDILMACVPAVIVATICYLLISQFLRAESKRHILEINRETTKFTTPVKMQAFERVILLLERIDPIEVVNRVMKPGMTCGQVKLLALAEIKQEFNHNITQQLYVSGAAWEQVKTTKDDAIKLITVTSTQVPDQLPAIEFSKKLVAVQTELNARSNVIALEVVKKEARKIF